MDGESSGRCDLETILQDPNAQPCDIPLHYLRDITDDFKEEIGHGGFGVVYKGVLPNGGMIAVKNLVIMQGIEEKQFQNEVNNLMRVRHQNIIRFVGYCYEARKKHMEYEGKYIFAERPKLLLCFEYIPKGSLDKYISGAPCRFGWPKCYKIIEGICHGLNYLHEECQTDASIVHLDLKPANILLDENMVPKIADFGLSRFFADKKTRTLASTPAGSLGYMAPEYQFGCIITTKADIYSLGVIIIQMITGQTFSPLDIVAVEPALEYWRTRLDAEPMHTSVEICCKQIKTCLDIGLSCVNSDHLERPTAREIIKRLKSLESIKCDVSDVERPAADKFISDHKELIEVTPTELQFFLALEQRIPCFLKLTNKTNESVAFCFPAVGPRHNLYVEPASGVIWPGSVSMVCVTMHEQQELPLDQQCNDQLLVQSIIVRKYIATSKTVVEDMFKNISSNLVHEVELTVVYVASLTSALDLYGDGGGSESDPPRGEVDSGGPAEEPEVVAIPKVREGLRRIAGGLFTPQTVAIGPYHQHTCPAFPRTEAEKTKVVRHVATLVGDADLTHLKRWLVSQKVDLVRKCYTGPLHDTMDSSEAFCGMLLRDGCYVLNFFLDLVPLQSNGAPTTDNTMVRDIVYLLENQVPLLLLTQMLDNIRLRVPEQESALECIANPVRELLQRQLYISNHSSTTLSSTPSDLVHLVHSYFRCGLPPQEDPQQLEGRRRSLTGRWRRATEYSRHADVRFRPQEFDRDEEWTILDIRHHGGTIYMPLLRVDCSTLTMLRNLMALEEQLEERPVTAYCFFLSQLACTAEDVDLLQRAKVLEHFLGSDDEVARGFADLCVGVALDLDDVRRNYLKPTWHHLDCRWRMPLHNFKGLFRDKYFRNVF